MNRALFPIVCALAPSHLALSRFALAQDVKQSSELSAIWADWQARQRMASAVRYVADGTITFPRGAFTGTEDLPEGTQGEIPPQDREFPVKCTWIFDFANNRFRRDSQRPIFQTAETRFRTAVQTQTYDGSVARRLEPREANTNSGYVPSPNQPELHDNIQMNLVYPMDWPFLFAHGRIPRRGRPVKHDALTDPLNLDDLAVQGRAEWKGAPCVVLRTAAPAGSPGTYDELWVDPAKESAIVHYRSLLNQQLTTTMDIEYALVAGRWLPKSATNVHYSATMPDRIREVKQFQIQEAALDPPLSEDAFRLEPSLGMVVADHKTHSEYRYGETASGTDWRPFAVVALAAIAVIALLVWRARRRRAS